MFCLAVGFSPVNVGNNPSDTKEHPLSRMPVMTTIELFFTVFDRVILIRAMVKALPPFISFFSGLNQSVINNLQKLSNRLLG